MSGTMFDAGSNMLNILYGGGSAGSSADPIQAFQTAEQNQQKGVAATAADPSVKVTIAQFTAAVQSAKSVTQLLANPAVMNVLLAANGMSDQQGYTALATKVLTSNLSDPTSLANTLTDSRWKTLAQTYNFAANGLSSIKSPTTLAGIAQAYAQTVWESNQDSVTPGLANALYFKSQAGNIKNVDQILSDPTLRTVVTTALGVPEQIAFQDVGAQEQAITTRLNVSDFKDPTFVSQFTQRYLIANSSSSSSSSASSTDMTSLALQAQGITV
jgi:hypothetical protein